jgi:transcriptional regulator with XRE-family HTH domain
MKRNGKSAAEAKAIGDRMRYDRKELRLVLADVQQATGVNVGQLSRFERGDFRTSSPNLQKVLRFLQTQRARKGEPSLVARFSKLVARSRRHEAAAAAIVATLEELA